jgi:hypothetical protein
MWRRQPHGCNPMAATPWLQPHGCNPMAATPCVQVLLVMLRGKKRFRVAGKALGSSVAIDHMLQPGDAIYIPAGCFHSGAACHTRCPAR